MRKTAVLCTMASAAVICSAALTVVVPTAATAAASQPRWAQGTRASVAEAPAAVLAGAPALGPVQIVSVSLDASGHPTVSVRSVRNHADALSAVTDAQHTTGTVAVSVEERVAVVAVAANVPSTDPLRYAQWGMDRLTAETVWGVHTAAGQTVAVIDTGVDAAHPDLAGVVLPGASFQGGTGQATAGDGRSDLNGHGTHVAGIIDAVANNGIGLVGLAQGAHILPVQVMTAAGSGSSADVAAGIIWAADHGATVINMSLGSPSYDFAEAAAVAYAQSKDVVVVAAAGNYRAACVAPATGTCGDPVFYPAAYPGVLAVAATDSTDASASFSETGSFVSLAAPGVNIGSTWPVADSPFYDYVYESGTSMAAPFVAASAALVRATSPGWTWTQVAADLTGTAEDLGTPGRDDQFGAGLVDPLAAVRAAQTGSVPTAAPPTPPSTSPTTSPTGTPAPTTAPVSSPPLPVPATTAPVVLPPRVVTHSVVHLALGLSARTVTVGTAVHAAITGSVTTTTTTTSWAGGLTSVGTSVSTAALTGSVTWCIAAAGKAYTCTHTVTATASTLRRTLTPRTGEHLYAQVIVADGTFTNSATLAVTVRPLLKETGGAGTVTASAGPVSGQRVALQHLAHHVWSTVATHVLTGSGRWTVRHLPAGSYRLSEAATAALLAATTAPVTVH